MLSEVLNSILNPIMILNIVVGVAGGICIGALPGLTATMGVAWMRHQACYYFLAFILGQSMGDLYLQFY